MNKILQFKIRLVHYFIILIIFLIYTCTSSQKVGKHETIVKVQPSHTDSTPKPTETPPIPLNLEEVSNILSEEFDIRKPYPKSAEGLGIEGTVYLKLAVDKKGKIVKIILEKSLYPELDTFSMEIIKALKFKPAFKDGIPVDVWVSYPVTYTLEGIYLKKPKRTF
jgi:TonB family protein